MQGTHQELTRLLGKFSSAILVTQAESGLRGRPMAIQRREGDRRIWMCTSSRSDKANDLKRDPRCALLFHDGETSTVYASLSGTVAFVEDQAKIRELWSAAWKAWFPDGPEQRDLTLLAFEPTHAEYVDPPGGKLGVMASALKRIVTGEQIAPKSEKSEVEISRPA